MLFTGEIAINKPLMSEDKQSTKLKHDTPLDGSDQVAVRQAKLDVMRENGFDPYSSNWEQSHTSLQAQGLLPEEDEEGPEVSVAGRIVAFRLMGKASFLKILDRDGRIQSYVPSIAHARLPHPKRPLKWQKPQCGRVTSWTGQSGKL